MKFSNQLEAEKELDCYMYCLYESLKFFNKKEYENAALYLENAARSLRELERMKRNELESRADDESTDVHGIAYININRGFSRY